eukprot:134875-Chlamydomonas_euryale.AAC.1
MCRSGMPRHGRARGCRTARPLRTKDTAPPKPPQALILYWILQCRIHCTELWASGMLVAQTVRVAGTGSRHNSDVPVSDATGSEASALQACGALIRVGMGVGVGVVWVQ